MSATDKSKHVDYFAEISKALTESLDRGIVPWRVVEQPTIAISATTGRRYQGFNALNLADHHLVAETGSNEWLSFEQAKSAGGSIKGGQTAAAFGFRTTDVPVTSKSGPVTDADGKPKMVTELRTYPLFHISQCSGIQSRQPDHAPWRNSDVVATVLATPFAEVSSRNAVQAAISIDMAKVIVAANLGTKPEPCTVDPAFASDLFRSNKRAFQYCAQAAQKLADQRIASVSPAYAAMLEQEKAKPEKEIVYDEARARKAVALLASSPDGFMALDAKLRRTNAALVDEYAAAHPDDDLARKAHGNLERLRAQHSSASTPAPAPAASPAPGM